MKTGQPLLDPLYWGTPACYKETFHPMGLALSVESNDPLVLEAARESFGRYAIGTPGQRSEFVIRLCIDPVHHQSRPWPKPSFRAIKHLFHIACGEASFAVADLRLRRAVGFVSMDLAQDTSFLRNAFIECLFYMLATHHFCTPVHSAVVAKQGRGVLLCGPSGSGKSSLAYACVKAGLQIVTDDVVHLCLDFVSTTPLLWGHPWHIRLLPDSTELFPELKGLPAYLRSDYEWYLEVDVGTKFPGSSLTSCVPAALVFLDRTSSPTLALQKMKPSDVLERLKRDIFFTEGSVRRRHYRYLRTLAQTNAYVLSYGRHPSTVVETIAGLCEALPGSNAIPVDPSSSRNL